MPDTCRRLRDLAPHLRIALVDLFDEPSPAISLCHPDGRAVDRGTPPYLAFADETIEVRIDATAPDDELLDRVTAKPEPGSIRSVISGIVIAGLAVDELCRDLDIFSGNVYLASEQAVLRLLDRAGLAGDHVRVTEALRVLNNCEVLYRFPVAYKFRGRHGSERQCRINGWGRILARTIATRPWGKQLDDAARKALGEHLGKHAADYRAHLAACALARDDGTGDAWRRAGRLAIPLLT